METSHFKTLALQLPGSYPVSAREGLSAVVSSDEGSQAGQETPHGTGDSESGDK
ncbi:hypothetical protein ACP70R_041260 [Stipagrostis hirtigluma subsp. patula]